MAQNYTLFSTAFVLQSPLERAWFDAVRQIETPEDLSKVHEVLTDSERYRLRETWENHGQCSLDIEGDTAIVYSEEDGSTEYAECVIQLYLSRFWPTKAMTLEVAYTCSKARPGEFGGAASLITAFSVQWMSTQSWVHEMRSRFHTIDSQ